MHLNRARRECKNNIRPLKSECMAVWLQMLTTATVPFGFSSHGCPEGARDNNYILFPLTCIKVGKFQGKQNWSQQETPLAAQWLTLRPPSAGGTGLISSQGTVIPRAAQYNTEPNKQ